MTTRHTSSRMPLGGRDCDPTANHSCMSESREKNMHRAYESLRKFITSKLLIETSGPIYCQQRLTPSMQQKHLQTPQRPTFFCPLTLHRVRNWRNCHSWQSGSLFITIIEPLLSLSFFLSLSCLSPSSSDMPCTPHVLQLPHIYFCLPFK